jgi:hypothetical protein
MEPQSPFPENAILAQPTQTTDWLLAPASLDSLSISLSDAQEISPDMVEHLERAMAAMQNKPELEWMAKETNPCPALKKCGEYSGTGPCSKLVECGHYSVINK